MYKNNLINNNSMENKITIHFNGKVSLNFKNILKSIKGDIKECLKTGANECPLDENSIDDIFQLFKDYFDTYIIEELWRDNEYDNLVDFGGNEALEAIKKEFKEWLVRNRETLKLH